MIVVRGFDAIFVAVDERVYAVSQTAGKWLVFHVSLPKKKAPRQVPLPQGGLGHIDVSVWRQIDLELFRHILISVMLS